MTQISVDQAFLEDLVDVKLQVLSEEMDRILTKWGYASATQFLQDARDGTLAEAEMDALSITNLIDQREELFAYKQSWV